MQLHRVRRSHRVRVLAGVVDVVGHLVLGVGQRLEDPHAAQLAPLGGLARRCQRGQQLRLDGGGREEVRELPRTLGGLELRDGERMPRDPRPELAEERALGPRREQPRRRLK